MPTFDDDVILVNASAQTTVRIESEDGDLTLGGGSAGGDLTINRGSGDTSFRVNGESGSLRMFNAEGGETVHMDGTHGNLVLGGSSSDGDLTVKHSNGNTTFNVNGDGSDLKLYDAEGGETVHMDGTHGNLVLGGSSSDGDLTVKNSSGATTISLNGDTGDITLHNADFAEDFSVAHGCAATPGALMALDDAGELRPTAQPYDKRVVGVVSGAGELRPGLVLDKQPAAANRHPISLVGKVYCLATAKERPIEVGDLLTSSDLPGHAMRATDPIRAFGTIIGKAMTPLRGGRGLVRVLITLQ
jgi:hypothetical protein